MRISTWSRTKRGQKGFTLVELVIVIVVIGVLASFGVPRFRDAVERSKAGESLNYLSAVRAAQERFHASEGTYAAALRDLDVSLPAPKYFRVGTIAAGSTADLESSWTLALTRLSTSAVYGEYTVVFTQGGYDSTASTINAWPAINPIGLQATTDTRSIARVRETRGDSAQE